MTLYQILSSLPISRLLKHEQDNIVSYSGTGGLFTTYITVANNELLCHYSVGAGVVDRFYIELYRGYYNSLDLSNLTEKYLEEASKTFLHKLIPDKLYETIDIIKHVYSSIGKGIINETDIYFKKYAFYKEIFTEEYAIRISAILDFKSSIEANIYLDTYRDVSRDISMLRNIFNIQKGSYFNIDSHGISITQTHIDYFNQNIKNLSKEELSLWLKLKS